MKDDKKRIHTPTLTQDGAGVKLMRVFPAGKLRHIDPFILFDHFGSDNADDFIAGFPDHPHRGFSTFTYMLDGNMQHRDSMGNTGTLTPGSAQWMKAGSGVIHSEMPMQKEGLMRGFQLWINLPAANKMDHPAYQEYSAEAFPLVSHDDYEVKVLIGEYANTAAPIIDDLTQVTYLDIQLNADRQFGQPLQETHNGFMYVFEGNGYLGDQPVATHSLITLDDAHRLAFRTSSQGARFVLISGKPIKEPIAQHGPFVMNTREEIEQAMRDFQSNNFVRDRAWMRRDKPKKNT